MNTAVRDAAIRAGCTKRQSELLGYLVEGAKVADAAARMGITESTAKNHLAAVRLRFDAPNTLVVVTKLLS